MIQVSHLRMRVQAIQMAAARTPPVRGHRQCHPHRRQGEDQMRPHRMWMRPSVSCFHLWAQLVTSRENAAVAAFSQKAGATMVKIAPSAISIMIAVHGAPSVEATKTKLRKMVQIRHLRLQSVLWSRPTHPRQLQWSLHKYVSLWSQHHCSRSLQVCPLLSVPHAHRSYHFLFLPSSPHRQCTLCCHTASQPLWGTRLVGFAQCLQILSPRRGRMPCRSSSSQVAGQ